MDFVVLAPLRKTVADCCNGDDAIREGISIAGSSLKYLRSLPNVLKDKICLLGFSEGALISMWAMTEPNDYSRALIMSPSNQCGMRRAGGKSYCGRQLVQSGKLGNIKKEIILTLGDSERRGAINATKGFAKMLSQDIKILKGDHKSFTVPRDDVNSIIQHNCS
jgi:dienelactone hydrolase